MSDAFSSSSESVLQRVVDVTPKTNTPVDKLQELYQIQETCEFVNERQFGKVRTSCRLHTSLPVIAFWTLRSCLTHLLHSQVALQFPDELLVDSVAVAQQIEENTNAKTYILGDTSYGR